MNAKVTRAGLMAGGVNMLDSTTSLESPFWHVFGDTEDILL